MAQVLVLVIFGPGSTQVCGDTDRNTRMYNAPQLLILGSIKLYSASVGSTNALERFPVFGSGV